MFYGLPAKEGSVFRKMFLLLGALIFEDSAGGLSLPMKCPGDIGPVFQNWLDFLVEHSSSFWEGVVLSTAKLS